MLFKIESLAFLLTGLSITAGFVLRFTDREGKRRKAALFLLLGVPAIIFGLFLLFFLILFLSYKGE